MYVYPIDDFPYIEFGNNPARKVRLVMSPFTSGKKELTIVHVTLPPHGISEGHIHAECDEVIYFSGAGRALIGGTAFEVPPNSVVIASQGKMHECVNTSAKDNLYLLCIFVPPFAPYGRYPELIELTNDYLKGYFPQLTGDQRQDL